MNFERLYTLSSRRWGGRLYQALLIEVSGAANMQSHSPRAEASYIHTYWRRAPPVRGGASDVLIVPSLPRSLVR